MEPGHWKDRKEGSTCEFVLAARLSPLLSHSGYTTALCNGYTYL